MRYVSSIFKNSLGYIYLFLLLTSTPAKLFAKEGKAKNPSLPSILKADQISGDQNNNTIDAIGNAELTNGEHVINSDKMVYDKNSKIVKALGNVKIKDYSMGNLTAEYADMKDDFTVGKFNNATVIFNDGSYLKSPEIKRLSESKTFLERPIFSVCPNPEISEDNKKIGKNRDAISLKSRNTLINKEDEAIRSRGAILRIYDVPVFYTPYLKTPFPSSKRKSGFLHPSYVNNDRLGPGVKIPYYFNISPNKDLTTTAEIHPTGRHVIVDNNFRHLLMNGFYDVDLEIANNKVNSSKESGSAVYASTITNPTTKSPRWLANSIGEFKFKNNIGLDFDINHSGDKNYSRDYRNSFVDHTVSDINLDYIKNREYYSVKTVNIQELDLNKKQEQQPLALPIINSYIESDPQLIGEKYSLLTNTTVISRKSGLGYRRLSMKPEVAIPYNLNGNLLELTSSVQSDFYNIDNNFQYNDVRTNNFDRNETNYRPELVAKWSLPLMKKSNYSTIIIEPMVKFVYSSYNRSHLALANEDSNNTELTYSNLFLNDRFLGFDRNETGKRASYGVRSSLFNSLGQFGLGLGQGSRESYKTQDVRIRGFNNNNKSNIVGELSYRSEKAFYVIYNFQLNESDYRNEINEVTSSLVLDRVTISSNYLLLRRTINNDNKIAQVDLGGRFNITKKLYFGATGTRDLVSQRVIAKRLTVGYDGCCVASSFSISESNPSNLVKPAKSYNISISIKNL